MARKDLNTEYRRIMNERGWTGVIDVDRMVKEIVFFVDFSDVPRKELERAYVSQRVMTNLNAEGFYSAGKHGLRMYCNADAIDEGRIKREVQIRETNKRIKIADIHEKLSRIAKRAPRDMCKGQLALNFGEDENGRITEDMTDEEFLEALSDLAEKATD